MKVIIPVAGKGTRVRPHSYSKPKPFLRVGKTTAIQFILDHMLTISPEEIIIVHDKYTGEYFKEMLPEMYPDVKFTFVLQDKQEGPAHALYMARNLIKEGDELIINYCDTLFVKDLSCLKALGEKYDGVVFVQEVEDYQRFGVVVHENHIMTNFIEKPEEPISKLANIANYYFKDGHKFMQYVSRLIEEDIRVKGELFLPEAFMMGVRDGQKYWIEDVDDWLDVGKIATVIETNAKLLDGEVHKETGVKVENTELGKNVTIGKNTTLIDCYVENSIIGENTKIIGLTIKDSVIGDKVVLKGGGTVFNIGDSSSMQ
jgi:glucose-1-phosphate thymidylyltransferase